MQEFQQTQLTAGFRGHPKTLRSKTRKNSTSITQDDRAVRLILANLKKIHFGRNEPYQGAAGGDANGLRELLREIYLPFIKQDAANSAGPWRLEYEKLRAQLIAETLLCPRRRVGSCGSIYSWVSIRRFLGKIRRTGKRDIRGVSPRRASSVDRTDGTAGGGRRLFPVCCQASAKF